MDEIKRSIRKRQTIQHVALYKHVVFRSRILALLVPGLLIRWWSDEIEANDVGIRKLPRHFDRPPPGASPDIEDAQRLTDGSRIVAM